MDSWIEHLQWEQRMTVKKLIARLELLLAKLKTFDSNIEIHEVYERDIQELEEYVEAKSNYLELMRIDSEVISE